MVYVVLGVFKLQNAAKIFSPLRCRTQKWHWKMKQLRCCIFLLFISFRITFGMLHHAPKVVGMRLSIQPDTTLCINMHHNELHDVTCDHCILLRLKIFSISCRYDVLTHFAWIHVCIFIYIYIHIFFQHNWIHIQPTRKKNIRPSKASSTRGATSGAAAEPQQNDAQPQQEDTQNYAHPRQPPPTCDASNDTPTPAGYSRLKSSWVLQRRWDGWV